MGGLQPHESLAMATPSDRYRPSYREYSDVINEYDYASDHSLLTVDKRGRIRVNERVIFIGVPFAGKTIGVRNTKGDEKDVYFKHQKLGRVDPNVIAKTEGLNLHTGEILRI